MRQEDLKQTGAVRAFRGRAQNLRDDGAKVPARRERTNHLVGRTGKLLLAHATPRRGAVLLEVVFSISILLVAMAVVGMTFNNSQHVMELADRMQHAQLLTERLLTELDTGKADDAAVLNMTEREQSSYFGDMAMPGMSYRIEIEPDENVDGLLKIDVYVYQGDPDDEDERQLILLTHHLRANPQGIDFAKDFGLDEEQLEMLTDAIPGGAAMFDPENFDPRDLARMDLDQLMDLLPQIIEQFGQFMGGAQLQALRQAVRTGDLEGLKELQDQGGQEPATQAPRNDRRPPPRESPPPPDPEEQETTEPPPENEPEDNEQQDNDTSGDDTSDDVPDDADSDNVPDDSEDGDTNGDIDDNEVPEDANSNGIPDDQE